jgi:hypothetical protein
VEITTQIQTRIKIKEMKIDHIEIWEIHMNILFKILQDKFLKMRSIKNNLMNKNKKKKNNLMNRNRPVGIPQVGNHKFKTVKAFLINLW